MSGLLQMLQVPSTDPDGRSPEEQLMIEIDRSLRQLTPDEEQLLRARFGLAQPGVCELVAEHAALSPRRRRIEAQAFRKLRAYAAATPPLDD
jgi:DNA-directed RNA polymerase sigma subunit (sigma70/sigma32)